MATFDLPIEKFEAADDHAVVLSKFEAGGEQRRALNATPQRAWNITAPISTESAAQAYKDFYDARGGILESFQWTPHGETVELTVRFDGPIARNYSDGAWKVSFAFVEVEA